MKGKMILWLLNSNDPLIEGGEEVEGSEGKDSSKDVNTSRTICDPSTP